MMSREDQDAIRNALALLRQYKLLHGFSLIMTVTGIVVLFFIALGHDTSRFWNAAVVLIIFAGVVELYFALRLAFDVELLRAMVSGDEDIDQVLSRLDRSLLRLKLMPAGKAERNLNQRLAGCFSLFRRQALCCGIQSLMLLIGAVMQLLSTNH